MAVIASLVVGANHATSKDGSSRALSTPADRERFLRRHRAASAFIIGKKSAVTENYQGASVPIFVFSRSSTPLHFTHPLMQQVTVDRDLGELTHRIDQRIPGEIVIEAGPTLLMALVEEGVVDLLELSISPIEGDGDFIDVEKLLKNFTIENNEVVDGTRLLSCRNQSNTSDRKHNP
jgi:riboflavin biosynthesis pyrimidine reductase